MKPRAEWKDEIIDNLAIPAIFFAVVAFLSGLAWCAKLFGPVAAFIVLVVWVLGAMTIPAIIRAMRNR